MRASSYDSLPQTFFHLLSSLRTFVLSRSLSFVITVEAALLLFLPRFVLTSFLLSSFSSSVFFSCFLRLLILSFLLPFMFFLHSFCRPFSPPSFRHPSCRGVTFFRYSLMHFSFSVSSSSALFVVSLRHMQSCLPIQIFRRQRA